MNYLSHHIVLIFIVVFLLTFLHDSGSSVSLWSGPSDSLDRLFGFNFFFFLHNIHISLPLIFPRVSHSLSSFFRYFFVHLFHVSFLDFISIKNFLIKVGNFLLKLLNQRFDLIFLTLL